MMFSHRVDFTALPWQQAMPGVRHKVLDQAGKRMRLVEYTPEMEPHWCEKGHSGYLLAGRFEIEFPDRTETYDPGDGLIMLPGREHKHRAKALTDVVSVFFVEDLD